MAGSIALYSLGLLGVVTANVVVPSWPEFMAGDNVFLLLAKQR